LINNQINMARPDKNRKHPRRGEMEDKPKKHKRPQVKTRPKHLKQWLMDADEDLGVDDFFKPKNGK